MAQLGLSFILLFLCSSMSSQEHLRVIKNIDEKINLKARAIAKKHISDDTIRKTFEEFSSEKKLLKSSKRSVEKLESSEKNVDELAKIALKVSRSILNNNKDENIKQYKAPNDFCPFIKIPYCDHSNIYRSEDGSCNNLNPKYAWWGMSNTPFQRLLEPAYNDVIDEPRTQSTDEGYSLPNPRKIAMDLNGPMDDLNTMITNLVPHFSQFLAHDITLTSLTKDDTGKTVACLCHEVNSDCINIPTPKNDHLNADQKCMAVPRSSASFSHFNCDLGAREQTNTRTAWLDLSQLYGNDLEMSLKLRLFKEGHLKSSDSHGSMNLPLRKNRCPLKHSDRCFKTADPRVHQNTMLTSMHTLFLREHNRLAKSLLKTNPYWNDEKVYQEARRILIAKYEHIIYNELLPILISSEVSKLYELEPLSYQYFYRYNPDKYPNVINEFSTAAFRFGHTLVRPYFDRVDFNFANHERTYLNQSVLNTNPLFKKGGVDSYIRGAMVNGANSYDLHFNKYLVDSLFEQEGDADEETKRFSLPALNINRGRDHGIQPYNQYRTLCGLNYAKDFDDLYNIPLKTRKILKLIYRNVNDIDLYIGGISETPMKGAAVGATFACIIAKQFQDLKFGDRFYYENGQDKNVRFTPEQLNEIRKSTLSRILCDNIETRSVRVNSFLRTSPWVDCDEIDKLSYEPWKDYGYNV